MAEGRQTFGLANPFLPGIHLRKPASGEPYLDRFSWQPSSSLGKMAGLAQGTVWKRLVYEPKFRMLANESRTLQQVALTTFGRRVRRLES